MWHKRNKICEKNGKEKREVGCLFTSEYGNVYTEHFVHNFGDGHLVIVNHLCRHKSQQYWHLKENIPTAIRFFIVIQAKLFQIKRLYVRITSFDYKTVIDSVSVNNTRFYTLRLRCLCFCHAIHSKCAEVLISLDIRKLVWVISIG